MRFPGRRKTKHYFPVSEEGRVPFDFDSSNIQRNYIVGVDQLLVDIEAHVDDSFLERFSINKGEY